MSDENYLQEIAALRAALAEAERERDTYRRIAMKMNHEVEQILGAALRYPRYCDSPETFPGATEADGVCVGDHVAETLAEAAAAVIERYRAALEEYADPANWTEYDQWIPSSDGQDVAERALAGGTEGDDK